MAGSSCELSGHGAWPVLQVSEISLACDVSVDYGFWTGVFHRDHAMAKVSC